MTGNPYNQVAYPAYPLRVIHPDRLATIGTLLGMSPAPVTSCRVLEIGCADGGNLIPMAYGLPGSRFLGVDLAEAAIHAGLPAIASLGLTNIAMEVADLRELGPRFGEFDYITAHGLYSWTPPDVRDRLLAVCRELLAPQGICFISYNTFPGGHVRQMIREMMLYHTRSAKSPQECLEQARWLLQFLLEKKSVSVAWTPWLESELRAMLQRNDRSLFHDDLGSINDLVYFRDFAAHAQRHRLQFLGEADPAELADPGGAMQWLDSGVIEREQYVDFLRMRRFRQTLLCREEIVLDRAVSEERMERYLFSAPTRFLSQYQMDESQVEGYRGVRVTLTHDAARRVAAALGAAYPGPVAFANLLPSAGEPSALQSILYGLMIAGFADIHVHDFPYQRTVTAKPAVSRLARYQAGSTASVTNLCHQTVQLDENGRKLLMLLDGSRDHAAIARDLASTPGSPRLEEIETHLPGNLERLAKMALLEQ